MKKQKNKPLILYEKYQAEHEKRGVVTGEIHKPKKQTISVFMNMLLMWILLVLVFLAIVGAVTLMEPQLRTLFLQIFRK